MNKKKIIIIAAAVILAVGLVLILVFSGKDSGEKIKVEGDTPFSVSVEGNTVNVDISGNEEWSYIASDDDSIKVEAKGKNSFTATCDEQYIGDVNFVCMADDGTGYVNTVVLNFDGSSASVINAFSSKQYGEVMFCTDSELPVTCNSEANGSVEVVITKNTEGIWEFQSESTCTVTQGERNSDGIHFTVVAVESGEFSVTFSNVTLGLTSKIIFEADDNLIIKAKSAEQGTCEKKSASGKESEAAENEEALENIKAEFTGINISDEYEITDALYEETDDGKKAMYTAKYSDEGGFTIEMKNFGLTEGFGYDYSAYEKSSFKAKNISVTLYSESNGSLVAEWKTKTVIYRMVADNLTKEDVRELVASLMG